VWGGRRFIPTRRTSWGRQCQALMQVWFSAVNEKEGGGGEVASTPLLYGSGEITSPLPGGEGERRATGWRCFSITRAWGKNKEKGKRHALPPIPSKREGNLSAKWSTCHAQLWGKDHGERAFLEALLLAWMLHEKRGGRPLVINKRGRGAE